MMLETWRGSRDPDDAAHGKHRHSNQSAWASSKPAVAYNMDSKGSMVRQKQAQGHTCESALGASLFHSYAGHHHVHIRYRVFTCNDIEVQTCTNANRL